jgi:hypothetical protein
MQILQAWQSGPDLDRAGTFAEDQLKPREGAVLPMGGVWTRR